MQKNMYEIFDEFSKATDKESRKKVLRQNSSDTLKKVLRAAFHPNIKFYIKQVPQNYKPSIMKPGMADYKMINVINKIYLFELGNPKTPANMSDTKRDKLLIPFLEGMEAREANVLIGMMFKTLDVRFLTYSLVKEVFPDIIP